MMSYSTCKTCCHNVMNHDDIMHRACCHSDVIMTSYKEPVVKLVIMTSYKKPVDCTVSEPGESLSGSFSSLDNPEQFESKKQLKETMEQGIHR